MLGRATHYQRHLNLKPVVEPMRINLKTERYFLLEGYTRQSMKTSKGIAKGEGIYRCLVIFSLKTGQIVRARDYSCPAGKRGYCKNIAALSYKLVECIMARKTSLPKSFSCTQINKQWGIPSLRTEQDPEREPMKRVPLQEINFVRQKLERDLAGGRKRKLPNETTSSYTSKLIGEPPIDQVRFSKLEKDLKKSKTQSILLLAIQSGKKSLHGREELQ